MASEKNDPKVVDDESEEEVNTSDEESNASTTMSEIVQEMMENKDIPSLKDYLVNLEIKNANIDKHIKEIKEFLKTNVPKKGKFTITVIINKQSFKIEVSSDSSYKDIRRKLWDSFSDELIAFGYTRTSFEMATNYDMEYGTKRLSHHPRATLSSWNMEGDVVRLIPKDERTKKRVTKKQALSEAMGKRDDKKHKDNKKDDDKNDDDKKGTKGTSSSSGYTK
ncbi:unnamed protein product [Symbiodinium sp. CCMP2592]|nr:unnamed protein product [Symbiodinium sp. CCMP2592]